MPTTFTEFEAQLSYVLHHLYNPSLHPPQGVLEVLGLSAQEHPEGLQTSVIQAVEDLRPAEYVPKSARSWRIYGILYYRFVSNLAQEEVADRLSITARHLRREQAGAVRILALKFWESAHLPRPAEIQEHEEPTAEAPAASSVESEARAAPPPEEIEPAGEAQLQNDLLALLESAPGVISNVAQVVKSVLALMQRVPAGGNIQVAPTAANGDLRAAIHPSALRQVLWMIIQQALTQRSSGRLSIDWSAEQGKACIDLTFSPLFALTSSQLSIIHEILAIQKGSLAVQTGADRVIFRVSLVDVNRTVLVVDDNPDIVHLYQRYLVSTPYYLVHLSRGEGLFEIIAEFRPDIIVLDIMLPDVDGWDLLTRLSENPHTQAIPVIICSVVNDTTLAAALGARACLTKPVQHREFIQALDQVSHPA